MGAIWYFIHHYNFNLAPKLAGLGWVVDMFILIKPLPNCNWEYCDRCAGEQAHLLIFDRSEKSWEEKIFQREENYHNTPITVWGM